MSAAAWKGKVDFGIITIREDECAAVLERFPEKIGAISGQRRYRLRRLTVSPTEMYTVAILRCIEQGNGEAHDAARDLLEDLAPRWLFVVGIAGGVPAHEFSLGDVIVSTRIIDFSVEAVLRGHSREYTLAGGPLHREAGKLAADIRAMVHDGELGDWNDATNIGRPRPSVEIADDRFYGDEAWKKDVREKIERHFDGKPPRPPMVTTGAIASSDRLIKEAEILQVWLKIARQIQAVEMESSGVYRATQGRVPFLAIRGISDVVGFKRHPDWTEYACHTAAAFLVAFLRTRPIPPRGDEHSREAAASHGSTNEVKAGSVSLMSNASAGSGKNGQGGHVLVEGGTGWGGANGGNVFVGPGDYRAGDGGAGPGGNLTIKGGDAFASPPPTTAVRSASGPAARSSSTPDPTMTHDESVRRAFEFGRLHIDDSDPESIDDWVESMSAEFVSWVGHRHVQSTNLRGQIAINGVVMSICAEGQSILMRIEPRFPIAFAKHQALLQLVIATYPDTSRQEALERVNAIVEAVVDIPLGLTMEKGVFDELRQKFPDICKG